jgi:hypothetical protein
VNNTKRLREQKVIQKEKGHNMVEFGQVEFSFVAEQALEWEYKFNGKSIIYQFTIH